MKLSKTQRQTIYALVAAIAVLISIALLNAYTVKQQEAERETARLKAEAEKQAQLKEEALQALTATQQYQKYCTKGVQRIDAAGDYSKIIYGTAQKTVTYYDKEGKRVYCTEGSTSASEACKTITALAFETAYVCSGTTAASTISGDNGLLVKTQITGNAAVIDTVLLEKPGFVVIHKKTGATVGDIITASQLLPQGASQIVSIAMPEALATWTTYIAMLHSDNGDGVFNADTDKPVMHSDGQKVMAVEFTAVKEN